MAEMFPTTAVPPRDLLQPPWAPPAPAPEDTIPATEVPARDLLAPSADMPTAAPPTPEVPDLPLLGGAPYRGPYRGAEPYSDALSANLINYVQPQIEGGNRSLIMSFTDAISQIDPLLAPNVTEGLKYKETTPAAVNALLANTTPEQKLGILNGLGDYTTTADHYLSRNPEVEFDVSLMNRDAIVEQSKLQKDTGLMASVLLQRGELATADSMKYLADEGITNSGQALATYDQMKTAFQHLDQSIAQTQRDGSTFMAVVSSPYAKVPLFHAVGDIDQAGVWHPQMNGFGMSTPARQQLMHVLERPEMQQHMAEQGITAVRPVFSSIAPPNTASRPPTRQQTQQTRPPWEAIEADPRYQQMAPAEQRAMKQSYFDENIATQPQTQQAIKADPNIYQPLSESFVGPLPMVGPPVPSDIGLSIGQAVKQQTQAWPKVAQVVAGDVAHIAEETAAFAAGATEGWVPKGMTDAMKKAAGRDTGTIQMAGRLGTDIYLGSKLPGGNTSLIAGAVNTGITEATRHIFGGPEGLPVFDNAANLSKQVWPVFGEEPTSKAADIARTGLGTALAALVLPGVAGKVGEQFQFQAEKIVGPLAEKTIMKGTAKVAEAAGKVAEVVQPLAQKIAARAAPVIERIQEEFHPTLARPSAAQAVPPPAEGHVRFYHGGIPGAGDKVVTQDLQYAQAYAAKTPGATVQYVDIPEDSPLLTKSGEAFDSLGLRYRTPYTPFQAPADIMKGAKPLPKVEDVVAPVVQTAGGKIVGDSSGIKWTTPQVVKSVLAKGDISGVPQHIVEQVAKEKNTSVNAWLARQVVENGPKQINVVSQSGGLRLIMANGDIIPPSKFPKLTPEKIAELRKTASYQEGKIFEPALAKVQGIIGTRGEINTWYKENNLGYFRVEKLQAVKGVKIVKQGPEWHVVSVDGTDPTRIFQKVEAAQGYVRELPVLSHRIENMAELEIGKQGPNPLYATATVKNPDEWTGNIASTPEYPTIAQTLIHSVMIPKTRFQQIERTDPRYPIYTEAWAKLEPHLYRQQEFAGPWNARLEDILGTKNIRQMVRGGTSKWNQDQMEGYMHLMQTQPHSQAWNTVIQQHKLDPQTGDQLRTWFDELAPKFGLNADEFLMHVMPRLQTHGERAFISGILPKSAKFFAEDFALGGYPLAQSGLDIWTLAKGFVNQGSFKSIVGPTYETVTKRFYDPKNPITGVAKEALDHYMKAIRGYGDQFDQRFLTASGNAMQRLFRQTGELPQGDAERIGRQMWAELYSANARGFFGFRPASVARQMMQTALTTYPRFGGRAVLWAMKAGRNPNYIKLMEQSRVFTKEFSSVEGQAAAASTRFVNSADNIQRKWAGLAGIYHYDQHVPAFISHQIDEKTFLKRSHLNLFDTPVQQQILNAIKTGGANKGRMLTAFHSAQDTQFPYEMRNRIPLFAGVGGRLFGQFGVFSPNYAEYLRQMWARGDWGDTSKQLTRWLIANNALRQGFRLAFGADASNWLFLHPVGFKGGSLFNDIVNQPMSAFFGTDQDQAQAVPKLLEAPLHYIPNMSAFLDLYKGATSGSAQGFLRSTVTGMPAYPEPKEQRFGHGRR